MATEFEEFDDDLATPTEADLNECYGSKYLSAADLGDRKIRTRIAKIRKETMQQQGGKPERAKFVIYLTTLDKPMVLNATNKNTLVDALGAKPADWVGAEVGLLAVLTQFAGKPVKGLRLRVLAVRKPADKAVAAPPPKPAPKLAAVEEMPPDDPEDPGPEFIEAAE